MTKQIRTARRLCLETAAKYGLSAGKFYSSVQLKRGFANGQLWDSLFPTWDAADAWMKIEAQSAERIGRTYVWSENYLDGYKDLRIVLKDGEHEMHRGTLESLFLEWRNNGSNSLEQAGECEQKIRDDLRRDGTYRIDGFVGCWFDITVVEEAA